MFIDETWTATNMTRSHVRRRYRGLILHRRSQFRILRLLQDNPELSQRELAKQVGVSTGGIHYVLNALVEKGMIKLSNFASSEDKRRYAYVLTPRGISERAALTRCFVDRKSAEYHAIKLEIEEISQELDPQVSELIR